MKHTFKYYHSSLHKRRDDLLREKSCHRTNIITQNLVDHFPTNVNLIPL